MQPSSPSNLLQQRIDPLTGESEWVVVRGDEASTDSSISLANTSYLDMLNDTHRNQAFEAAITRALRTSPCLVLDIGAGTGLLSMMASRSLQDAVSLHTGHEHDKFVIACEAFLPMYILARKVLHLNGFSSSVHLVHKRSEDMEVGIDMVSRADVLVTELLDSTFLGEGLIPTLQHAHDFLLKPNATVIPHKATIFGQLIQCDQLWRMQDLQGVESQTTDRLTLFPSKLKQKTLLKPLQYAMHVDALMNNFEMITHPFKVFEFDFSKKPASYAKTDITVKALKTGVAHAIISWWVLELDYEGLELYSTAPRWIKGSRNSWHDHWKQCVWFVPGQGLDVVKGADIQLSASHDDITFEYDLNLSKDSIGSVKTQYFIPGSLSMRPERIGLLGSLKWRSIIMASMKKVLHGSSSYLCLVVDDSLPLTITAAATSRSATVVSLLPGLQSIDMKWVKSLLDANGVQPEQVKVIGKKVHELNEKDFGGRKVDVLIGEPYYQAYEDMLPWRSLRFWKERTSLATILNENATIVPCKGILYGMAMSMHDLWKSRRALQLVQGFNHSSVNKVFGACGDLAAPLEGPILPFHLWQCGDYQELTKPFPIMTFKFSKAIETVKSSVKVPILKSGVCHGMALWIEWVMHAELEERVFIGPNGHEPTYWKQGVKLFRSPVQVERFETKNGSQNGTVFDLDTTFDSESGDLHVSVYLCGKLM